MDFSQYGVPSKEWLNFVTRNPTAAQDGFSNNDTLEANQLRETVNAARESASKKLMSQSGLVDKVNILTLSIQSRGGHSIPLRRYSPRDRRELMQGLVYFHGGGFLFGSEGTDDYLCATMSETLGVVVLSVIYRHTPDSSHPAQHEDARDALEYIKANASTLGIDVAAGVGVLGISAGGGLAATAILRDLESSEEKGDRHFIKGVVLAIPWLIHVENYPFELFIEPQKSAHIQCRDAPVIPWARLKMFSDLLDADSSDPLLNVALTPNESLREFPRTAILVAGMDPLRDDGLLFATKLKAKGVPTSVSVFPGLPHGFRRWADLPATKVFDSRILESIRWALGLESCLVDNFEDWYEYKEE
ncbi:Alpha/Beta hydrolase protein [Talaromyces proteolyticus]|uniref:Alpha/Beta hydrolase protein n=1 Tax=Talaromyces proteolyticus TaxID=1131652 RepID=A0AAD4Q2A1_9EURO|nr:Alpha/Beta hydrolase protein [Talaromyces proteolyticus]KAH8700161.1 Alpha/Beta hydrolase protein [Talaromyces proteolyticus]